MTIVLFHEVGVKISVAPWSHYLCEQRRGFAAVAAVVAVVAVFAAFSS